MDASGSEFDTATSGTGVPERKARRGIGKRAAALSVG